MCGGMKFGPWAIGTCPSEAEGLLMFACLMQTSVSLVVLQNRNNGNRRTCSAGYDGCRVLDDLI